MEKTRPKWFNPIENISGDGHFITGLKLSNSLTGRKDLFVSSDGSNRVTWYMCGPTVYDHSHLGHARTFVTQDIMRRLMQDYFNYDLDVTMNITDIDDKIIARSLEEKKTLGEVSKYWENEFFEDMKRLNVLYPNRLTRVTEFVAEVITFIEKIIENGFAYESEGSVYFDIEAFKSATVVNETQTVIL